MVSTKQGTDKDRRNRPNRHRFGGMRETNTRNYGGMACLAPFTFIPDKVADEIYATLWVAGERMFRGPVSQLIGKGDYCPSGVNRNFNLPGHDIMSAGP